MTAKGYKASRLHDKVRLKLTTRIALITEEHGMDNVWLDAVQQCGRVSLADGFLLDFVRKWPSCGCAILYY
jgi:hypothetical protein